MALTEPGRMVKSARTAFEIIEYIHEQDGAELGELADQLDLAKSTIHGYLATLESLEYLVNEGGRYHLSLKFLYHGTAARNAVPLSGLADGTLTALAEETSLVAWLVVEEHGRAVYLDRVVSNDAVRTYGRVSKRTDLHGPASGKAILAHLPDSRIRDILDSYGLPARTEHTITDEETLFEELSAIRRRGYATSEHEVALGVQSVAAPVHYRGEVLGAISVSGTSNQVDEEYFETELPDVVTLAAADLADQYAERHG
ncbi:IclR family transcriptional regulator [Haloglomus litoreum]|uniref:IclR family transcriptional regulator n=1 Tax=Haloglomus litoreum TaxID=3034026 RepID=UPI0023E7C532|nr:IclR family transcriptional regulator [Haloglomus sp. DT116]